MGKRPNYSFRFLQKKHIEGFIGGLCFYAHYLLISLVLVISILDFTVVTLVSYFIAFISVLSVPLGDLVESKFKETS